MDRRCDIVNGWDWKEYDVDSWEELLPFQEEIKLKGYRVIRYKEHYIGFLTCPFRIVAYNGAGTLKKPVADLLGVEVGEGD